MLGYAEGRLRSCNASQLYHHFPPKRLVYRLKRQQLRQAGEHNVTSIDAPSTLRRRGYAETPARDASDALTRLYVEVKGCL